MAQISHHNWDQTIQPIFIRLALFSRCKRDLITIAPIFSFKRVFQLDSYRISTESILKTEKSPRAHVAKFYGRLRLIRGVYTASKFPL